jgi:transposase-like protein
MERQPRKRYTGEQIIGFLKRHLVEGVPISDVCEQAGIHPTQFYRWQKQLFEVGASVFDRKPGRAEAREVEAAREKVAELEQRLQKKHEVLSELMEEHVALRKGLGEA